jgi:hypothetical protein
MGSEKNEKKKTIVVFENTHDRLKKYFFDFDHRTMAQAVDFILDVVEGKHKGPVPDFMPPFIKKHYK